MADTREFFETVLPEKLANNPGLAGSVNAVYQFDISGAGTWSVDLTSSPGAVSEGPHGSPGCVVTVDQADWERILDSPALSMTFFTMGKLKGTQAGLVMQLQRILA